MSKNVSVSKYAQILMNEDILHIVGVNHEENNSKDESNTFPKQQVWYTKQQISKG